MGAAGTFQLFPSSKKSWELRISFGSLYAELRGGTLASKCAAGPNCHLCSGQLPSWHLFLLVLRFRQNRNQSLGQPPSLKVYFSLLSSPGSSQELLSLLIVPHWAKERDYGKWVARIFRPVWIQLIWSSSGVHEPPHWFMGISQRDLVHVLLSRRLLGERRVRGFLFCHLFDILHFIFLRCKMQYICFDLILLIYYLNSLCPYIYFKIVSLVIEERAMLNSISEIQLFSSCISSYFWWAYFNVIGYFKNLIKVHEYIGLY